MNRRPERLGDLLPGVVAQLVATHTATNGEPPMREQNPALLRAVQVIEDAATTGGVFQPGAAFALGELAAAADIGPGEEASHVADRLARPVGWLIVCFDDAPQPCGPIWNDEAEARERVSRLDRDYHLCVVYRAPAKDAAA